MNCKLLFLIDDGTSLFRSFAWLECHPVATIVLNVREHLPHPIMLLRVLALVLELVAVFCVGVELRNGIGERRGCRKRCFKAVGAYVNLF